MTRKQIIVLSVLSRFESPYDYTEPKLFRRAVWNGTCVRWRGMSQRKRLMVAEVLGIKLGKSVRIKPLMENLQIHIGYCPGLGGYIYGRLLYDIVKWSYRVFKTSDEARAHAESLYKDAVFTILS